MHACSRSTIDLKAYPINSKPFDRVVHVRSVFWSKIVSSGCLACYFRRQHSFHPRRRMQRNRQYPMMQMMQYPMMQMMPMQQAMQPTRGGGESEEDEPVVTQTTLKIDQQRLRWCGVVEDRQVTRPTAQSP